MDLSSEDDPDSSKLLRSFDEVWHDQLAWEELRSARHGRVLKKVCVGILSVESTPVLLFGACSGVGAFPVSRGNYVTISKWPSWISRLGHNLTKPAES